MRLARGRFLRRSGLRRRATIATVIANPIDRDVVDHRLGVHIGYAHIADVVDRTVVIKMAALPITAFVTATAITVAVVDATIETHLGPQ